MALSTYTYEQLGFGTELGPLTDKEKEAMEKSWAAAFASDIFPYIDEQIFIPLYSEKKSRRNVPVNVLAGAMLLQEIRGMSDEDLVEAAMFDLRLRTALHITNAVGQPLSLRTIQRFRTRIKRYRESGGEDLLGICFDQIGDRLEPFLQKYAKFMVSASRTAEENRNRRKAGNHTGAEEMAAPGASDRKGTKNDDASVSGPVGTEHGNVTEKQNAGDVSDNASDAAGNEKAVQERVFDPSIPANPEIFKENCLQAHSDHLFFADEDEMETSALRTFGADGSVSLRFSLNGPWKYCPAERPADAPVRFEELSYDCRSWAEIRIPEQRRPEEYGVPADQICRYPWDGLEDIIPGGIPERFNPTASYVKYFRVPDAMQGNLQKGSPMFISFRDVEGGLALWCNGHYVGYSEGGFSISEFDLTPFVQDGENKLAVRVFKWTASSWLDCRDAFRNVGITGDVYLYTVPAAHIFDLRIRPKLNETLTEGTLEIEACIMLSGACKDMASDRGNEGRSEGGRPDRLCLYYSLMKGEENVLSGAAAVDANVFDKETSTARVSVSEKIESPDLWSVEDPQLYELVMRLEGGKIKGETAREAMSPGRTEQAGDLEQKRQAEQVLYEIVREKAGFRRFEEKDGQMYLNGKRIVFRGVDLDESEADTSGAAAGFQDLQEMKRNNINAIRTYHNPGLSDICRSCDELGLYLIVDTRGEIRTGQAPLESGIPAPGMVMMPGPDARWSGLLQDRASSCCLRYGNHPSILIRSAKDESGEGSVIIEKSDYLRNLCPECPDSCEKTFHNFNRGLDYGRLQEIKYKYQSIRFEVKKDSVRVMNDNLYTGTDRYECLVCLDREGHRIAEARLKTAVEPLSEAEYAFPGKILDKVRAIHALAEKEGIAVEYAVTVSMCLSEDCAWAGRGHETAFCQGVFIAGEGAGGEDTGDAAGAASSGTAAKSSVSGEGAGGKDTGDTAGAASSGTDKNNSDFEKDTAGEGTVTEITGTDSKRSITLRTPEGKLELIRGSYHTGIRGDNFEALFSVLEGGIVSFRRIGNLFADCGIKGYVSGRIPGGAAAFKAGELFEKMPRPCFWSLPFGNNAGNHVAAAGAIWNFAGEYLIPRIETLRIFTESESVLLRMQYALPIPGVVLKQRQAEEYGEPGRFRNPVQDWPAEMMPAVKAGYRFYADGRLKMTLDWEPVTGETDADRSEDSGYAAPALPPFPFFGFNFSLNSRLDRFVYYGNGPAENHSGCSCGARLGIYSGKVAEQMPSDSGNRAGVRWAEVTDCSGGGIRFTAGTPEDKMSGPDVFRRPVPVPRVMELSILSCTAQKEGNLFRPYESASMPGHFTGVRCGLMNAETGCSDGGSTRTMPYYGMPADRKLHFAVTVEAI